MIVFDLDDTLYKEADYVASGCRAVAQAAEEAGVIDSDTAYQIITGTPNPASGFDRLINIAIGKHLSRIFNIEHILTIYRTHTPDITLTDDTIDVLNQLRESRINLGIITDGRTVTQRTKIKALGLDLYFPPENILISQETGYDKHHVQPFKMMMERNPRESQYSYIGDNPEKDFYWPNKLGWQTVMLLDTNNHNIHPQKQSAYPDFSPISSIQAKHTIICLSDLLRPDLLTTLR